MEKVYITSGSCSRRIRFTVEGGIIREVTFEGGCDGNTKGVGKLVVGMKVEDVIERLRGIDCGGKGTSCPDQLAKALEREYGKACG